MKKFVPALLLTALVAFAFSDCLAGKPPKKPKPTPAPVAIHTVIASISADSITVKEPKETKIYKISKFTQIFYQNQSVKVDALKAGMRVDVAVGSDPGTAERITAGPAPGK